GKKKEIVVPEHALTLIKQVATYKVEGAVITVDGGDYLALVNEAEAQQVLDELIAEYVPEGANIVEKGFVENVTVSLKFVVSSAIISMEEAKKRFEEGTQITRTYTVASGDSIYKIASINGVTVEDLLSTNPELTMNSTLRVGDQLKVNGMEPFLSVKTAENVVFTEKQEKEIQYQQDNTRPTSYKRVVQQGKDGQKEVVTQIIRVNGFETEQRVISETTTVEPVPEIIVVGTL
ncbi:MAG: G5 domain-containing protein, partial [Anaerotignaceae bacterium]